jgi:hypothetical protein
MASSKQPSMTSARVLATKHRQSSTSKRNPRLSTLDSILESLMTWSGLSIVEQRCTGFLFVYVGEKSGNLSRTFEQRLKWQKTAESVNCSLTLL